MKWGANGGFGAEERPSLAGALKEHSRHCGKPNGYMSSDGRCRMEINMECFVGVGDIQSHERVRWRKAVEELSPGAPRCSEVRERSRNQQRFRKGADRTRRETERVPSQKPREAFQGGNDLMCQMCLRG